MLENVDVETLKQIGLVIGTVVAGIAVGVAGVLGARKKPPPDEEERPLTKADLESAVAALERQMVTKLDLHRSMSESAEKLTAVAAALAEASRRDRHEIYNRIQGVNGEIVAAVEKYDNRLGEFARHVSETFKDVDRRLRQAEIGLASIGPRRPRT